MLLAIDAGNSNITIGILNQSEWINWRLSSNKGRTADEYGAIIRTFFTQEELLPSKVKAAVISSVVPPLTTVFTEMLHKMNVPQILNIAPGIKTSIKLKTSHPVEVGSDLICNAAGAWEKHKQACIIVDFGTALTFSAISQEGDFLGAAFLPGLQTAASALAKGTARLPLVEFYKTKSIIGKDSQSAIQAGLFYGYQSAIEGMLKAFRKELGQNALSIATGGSINSLPELSPLFDYWHPLLILEGMRVLAETNSIFF